MLSYRICEKLKKAGFPQFYNCAGLPIPTKDRKVYLMPYGLEASYGELNLRCAETDIEMGDWEGADINYKEHLFVVPLLSELIEVCGKVLLIKIKKEWFATKINMPGDCIINSGYNVEINIQRDIGRDSTVEREHFGVIGNTAEEAVANLFLELQNE